MLSIRCSPHCLQFAVDIDGVLADKDWIPQAFPLLSAENAAVEEEVQRRLGLAFKAQAAAHIAAPTTAHTSPEKKDDEVIVISKRELNLRLQLAAAQSTARAAYDTVGALTAPGRTVSTAPLPYLNRSNNNNNQWRQGAPQGVRKPTRRGKSNNKKN